jgi:hypothetical protein
MTIKYCTTDLAKWGVGLGRLLHDFEVDDNFFDFESQLAAFNDHLSGLVVSLASITFTPPNQLFFHLTDSTILGPFTLPTATWNLTNLPTGAWLPSNVYVPYDVFNDNGTVYLVARNYTSGLTFDPNVTDGMGHNLLSPIVTFPTDVLPLGGNVGDVLTVTVPGGPDPPTTQWIAPAGLAVVQTQSDHTFTPTLADSNTYNRFTNPDGCIFFVPADDHVNFPVGTEIHSRQANGTHVPVLFEGVSAAQINPVTGFLNQTAGDGATVTLKKVGADSWDIFGLLATHA